MTRGTDLRGQLRYDVAVLAFVVLAFAPDATPVRRRDRGRCGSASSGTQARKRRGHLRGQSVLVSRHLRRESRATRACGKASVSRTTIASCSAAADRRRAPYRTSFLTQRPSTWEAAPARSPPVLVPRSHREVRRSARDPSSTRRPGAHHDSAGSGHASSMPHLDTQCVSHVARDGLPPAAQPILGCSGPRCARRDPAVRLRSGYRPARSTRAGRERSTSPH